MNFCCFCLVALELEETATVGCIFDIIFSCGHLTMIRDVSLPQHSSSFCFLEAVLLFILLYGSF